MKDEAPARGHAGDGEGYRSGASGWSPEFPGQRAPFEPGHDLTKTHGAYGAGELAPRVERLTDELTVIVPAATASDEPTIRLLALVLARIELVGAWLEENGLFEAGNQPQPVLRVLSTWENTAARLCAALGLTPTARKALGMVAPDPTAGLRAHLAENYPEGGR